MSRVLTHIAYQVPDSLPGVEVVPMRNMIVIDGKRIKLTRVLVDVAFEIHKVAPHSLSLDQLQARVRINGRAPSRNVMYQHICRLRKMLAGTRLSIVRVDAGYLLINAVTRTDIGAG